MLPSFRIHEKLTETEISKMDMPVYLDKVIDPKNVIHVAYRNLNEVFSGDIPDDVLEKFKLNPYKDHILENLQTHDSDTLIKKIREKFDVFVEDDSVVREGGKRYLKLYLTPRSLSVSGKDVYDTVKSDQFENLAGFFGYSVSNSYELHDGVIVFLEPIYSDDANEKVYGEKKGCSYGRIYHITTKENAEKILRVGFRVSSPEDKRKDSDIYRVYPKRTYFLAIPPKKEKIEERPEIQKAVELYFSESQIKKGYCILQADVRGLDIDFYMDSVSQGDYDWFDMENDAVYTYCNIPKERIKLVYCSK